MLDGYLTARVSDQVVQHEVDTEIDLIVLQLNPGTIVGTVVTKVGRLLKVHPLPLRAVPPYRLSLMVHFEF